MTNEQAEAVAEKIRDLFNYFAANVGEDIKEATENFNDLDASGRLEAYHRMIGSIEAKVEDHILDARESSVFKTLLAHSRDEFRAEHSDQNIAFWNEPVTQDFLQEAINTMQS